MENKRQCRICKKWLDASEFYKHKGYKDGIDHACKECQKQYQKNFRKSNPEIIKDRSKTIRERDKEKIKQRQKEYYEKTKLDPYYIKKRKDCYNKNKDKWHKNEKERRKFFNEKWKKPCIKCGESRLYLIQFHHIDHKTKDFSIGANATSKSEEVLKKEIEKCVCLCSNCHDEFHYFYGQKPQHPEICLQEYLNGGDDCG